MCPADEPPATATAERSVSPILKTWHVGTLTYTRNGLFNVFFWMLWGDFCLTLMDSGVGTSLITLQLQKYGASKIVMGLVQGTVIEFLAVAMVAIISTWSDRHRGRLGRRMPFMLYTAAPIAFFLTLVGFSPGIAAWLQRTMPHAFGGIALGSMTVGVIAVTFVGYKFFDMFPQSVYWYLFADVIPHNVMGTFACLFRVCSTLGGMAFSWFMLPYCRSHPAPICAIAGGLYLVSFVMLSLMVKEGEYPPPPVEPLPSGSAVDRAAMSIWRYAREVFFHPYYWTIYLFYVCFTIGIRGQGQFLLPYVTETLKLDLRVVGRIDTAVGGVTLGIFFLAGPLIDRFHPLRAGMFGLALVCVTSLASYFGIHGTRSYVIWIGLLRIAGAIFQVAVLALLPRLFPREQYGQFCSANAIVFHVGLAAALPACGWLLERTKNNTLIFAWYFAFSALALLFMVVLYRRWKRLGGDEHYTPPVTAPGAVVEVEAPAEAATT